MANRLAFLLRGLASQPTAEQGWSNDLLVVEAIPYPMAHLYPEGYLGNFVWHLCAVNMPRAYDLPIYTTMKPLEFPHGPHGTFHSFTSAIRTWLVLALSASPNPRRTCTVKKDIVGWKVVRDKGHIEAP